MPLVPRADFWPSLSDAPVCVLAFASGARRFEWGPTLSRLGVAHILLRDRTERWYQGGVDGLGSLDDVVAEAASLKDAYPRVVALGLSSGSYAALLVGQRAELDAVVAISPITGKGDALFPDFDPRWHFRIEHGPEHPPVPDLKPLYADGARMAVRAFVSDGEGTELDRRMAERIGVSDIVLIPGYSHSSLARAMRGTEALKSAILG